MAKKIDRLAALLARWCPRHCAEVNAEPYKPNDYARHVAKAILADGKKR